MDRHYLNYCNMLGLAKNSSKELVRYIQQLDAHLIKERLSGVGHIQYQHLFDFAVSGNATPTTVKARI